MFWEGPIRNPGKDKTKVRKAEENRESYSCVSKSLGLANILPMSETALKGD